MERLQSFNEIYGTIKEETEKNGVICCRADEMNGSQPMVLCQDLVQVKTRNFSPF